MANTLELGNGKWATGKDTVLAFNDENNNFKPLPFSFSRNTSATVVNKEGLIETVGSGEPRIDFKDNTKGALKLEPTRTNYVTYSNGFTDSSWLPTGVTVVSGVISPDGTSNAFTLSNTASSGIIQKAVSLTGLRVVSIFAKKGTHRYLSIGAYGGTNSYANFDLENGVVTNGTNANIEDYGNGWFRCICHSADGATGGVQIFPSNNTTGAATTNGSIQIYGVQLEQGSYATSYIPTSGSAVTRVLDVCTNGGNNQVINSTEGVLYVEIKRPINQLETSQYLGVSDGSTDNRFIIGASAGSSNLRFIGDMNDVRVLDVTRAGFNKEDWLKIAIVWDLSEFKIFINGTKNYETTLSDNFTPNRLNTFEFANGSKSSVFYGISKDVRVYNTALTDQELAALTTI